MYAKTHVYIYTYVHMHIYIYDNVCFKTRSIKSNQQFYVYQYTKENNDEQTHIVNIHLYPSPMHLSCPCFGSGVGSGNGARIAVGSSCCQLGSRWNLRLRRVSWGTLSVYFTTYTLHILCIDEDGSKPLTIFGGRIILTSYFRVPMVPGFWPITICVYNEVIKIN